MAFLRRNLPKMAVGDVKIFIGRNLSYLSKGGFESSNSRSLGTPGNDALEDLPPERDIFWRQNIFGPILFY